jgi:hypothetical protein
LTQITLNEKDKRNAEKEMMKFNCEVEKKKRIIKELEAFGMHEEANSLKRKLSNMCEQQDA